MTHYPLQTTKFPPPILSEAAHHPSQLLALNSAPRSHDALTDRGSQTAGPVP